MTEEDSTTIVRELIAFLRSTGTQHGIGASPAEVDCFCNEHRVVLPTELRAYFESCNGTNGDYAYGMICFWSLEQLRTVESELIGPKRDCPAMVQSAYKSVPSGSGEFYVFADLMHESQLYAIRLGQPGIANIIIVLDGDTPREVAGSFGRFLALYMHAPGSIGAVTD